MLVFCNPYHALDRLGRLAGACPEGEETRIPSALPVRRYVSAELVIKDGSHEPAVPEYQLDDKADRFWSFKPEPVDVPAIGGLLPYWVQRVRDGEVFKLRNADDLPLTELAKARTAAIANWRAHHQSEPDSKEWAAQFPLDARVAAEAARLEAVTKPREAPPAAPDVSPPPPKATAEAAAATPHEAPSAVPAASSPAPEAHNAPADEKPKEG